MTVSIVKNAEAAESQGAEAQAGRELQLARPAAIETVRVPAAPGDTYAIQFDPSSAQVAIAEKDLVLSFPDGGRLVFVGLVDAAAAANEPQFLIDGTEIGSTALLGQALALSGETTLETAASSSVQSGGGSVYADGSGEALNLLDGADVLDGTELIFRTLETTSDDPTLAESGSSSSLQGIAYSVGGLQVGVNGDKGAAYLYKIDLATGETTVVGQISDKQIDVEGMALNPADGLLYGASTQFQPGLVLIDPETGASTFFTTDKNLWSLVEGMAFDSSGNLFAVTDAPDLGLYSVDLTAGNEGGLTRLGDLSIDPDQKVEGISIDPVTGNVFIIAGEDGVDTTIYQIDPADGSLISFSPVTTAGGVPVTELEGLAFDGDGTLWVLQSDGGGVYVINPDTGAATFVSDSLGLGEISDNFESLALYWEGMEYGSADPIYGSSGDDVLNGTTADDEIHGFAGNDTLNGGLGDDILRGGGGNDMLNGGQGNDNIAGGSGDDVILGGDGNDTIFGNSGTDELNGGAGDDTLWGSDDTILPGGGSNRVFDNGGNNVVVYKFGDVEADATDELLFFEFGPGNSPGTTDHGDAIDVSDVLTGAGYDPMTDLLENFIQVTSTGTGDSVVSVSLAGDGTNFVDIAQIVGRDVSLGDLLANDNLITA